jgi:RNA recognition motif-containing protein
MSTKLYVGNLPYSATDESLAHASTSDEAARSISQLNGTQLDGRAINVSEAKPQAPRTGGGGGFNSRRY